MSRLAPALLTALALTAPATAQPSDVPAVKLTVSPAAAPTPALKYELFYHLKDRLSGNAATRYNRAFLIQNPDDKAPELKQLQTWLDTPADQFPAKQVREYLARHSDRLRELDSAARFGYCDWQLMDRMKADAYAARLPEAEAARDTARLLALRIRVELAENRFADAVRSLRTGFQLARHIGEAPSTINLLVGVAVAGLMADRLEELVQRPGAPNLYWALSGLSRPLIDPRPAIDGEEVILRAAFPMIDEFSKGPVGEKRAADAVKEFFQTANKLSEANLDESHELAFQVAMAALAFLQQQSAKKFLMARGWSADDVGKMPAAQAVFLSAWARYSDLRSDEVKWMRLPPSVALAELAKAEHRSAIARAKVTTDKDYFMMPFLLVHPAFGKVFQAHVRLERRLAALRAVEALRLHAAAHGGKWPATLGEVTAVAVPDDPATGKPFAYAVNGDTATLSGPPPRGRAPNRGDAVRYELTPRRVK
jgi:hypothetical protein